MSDKESIKLKIAALLAKAESTTNEFEAAAFMAKVNELLEKYQLDLHQVRVARDQETDPMGKQAGETNLYASMLWARDLIGALARYYGCRMVYRRKGNHFAYDLVGRESARITCELMVPYIITQVRLQAKKLDGSTGNNKSRSILERQVGQALTMRVWALVGDNERQRVVLTGKGLIPVDDVDAAVEDFFPKLKMAASKPVHLDRDAVAAAAKIGLHHQATGRHTKLLK